MKHRKIIVLAGVILLLFGSLFYIRAEKIDPVSVINTIFTGHVQIELKQYEVKNGKEIPITTFETVLPGESLSLIPRIYNKGENCWIRAKVSWDTGENGTNIFPEINGMNLHWKEIGEYYYYQMPLEKNENVSFFHEIKVPDIYQNEDIEKLSMRIQVDAIQQANFEPDFTSTDPWYGQEIEVCIINTELTEKCPKLKKELLVEYNEAAKELLLVPKDFFINFETMMPGDIWQDTIQINNEGDEPLSLYFSSELYGEEEIYAWMDKIILRMWSNDRTIYEGSLISKELEKGLLLYHYEPSQKEEIFFELEIPKELNNTYALKEGKVKWSFYAEQSKENSSETNEEESSLSKEDEQEKTKNSKTVKTGDDTMWAGWILLMAGTGIGIIWIVRKRRK